MIFSISDFLFVNVGIDFLYKFADRRNRQARNVQIMYHEILAACWYRFWHGLVDAFSLNNDPQMGKNR